MTSPLIESLRRAVAAAPDDTALRLHLAEQLLAAGDRDGAVATAAVVLQQEPTNQAALRLVTGAAAEPSSPELASPQPASPQPASGQPSSAAPTPTADAGPAPTPDFDWRAAEAEVGDLAGPMFVEDAEAPDTGAFSVEHSGVTLADVGGMQQVKERLEAAFLAPLRNPELRRLYAKSLRGGLLLYGPPGCGKTFLARAVAGELGAQFLSIGLTDVLDPYIGSSERNLHEAFTLARREAPCVLFFDELDALGQRRSMTRNNAMRGVVNQLLTELDGVDGMNDGVFVLAATNQPWDVDPAIRRPGRLDRTLLVLPPDAPAREAIFRFHLRHRPIEAIDLRRLAARTDGFSGADIAYVCELAAEQALLDGVRSGSARMIGMADLDRALADSRPSIGPWLESARNVVLFADQDGAYGELRAYLKRARRL